MITENNGRFLIETDHTSYLFYVDPAGFLTHLYYGEKLFLTEDGIDAMIPGIPQPVPTSIGTAAVSSLTRRKVRFLWMTGARKLPPVEGEIWDNP